MEEFDPAQKRTIMLKVNGTDHQCEVDVRMHLADCLRGELGLTGTHVGCEHGVCGACTVLVGGPSARRWLVRAGEGNRHALPTGQRQIGIIVGQQVGPASTKCASAFSNLFL